MKIYVSTNKNKMKQIVEKKKDIDKQVQLNIVNDETETFHVKTVGRNIGQQIVQGRLAKKWNQKQLANAMCKHISIIVSYENGSAVRDHATLQKFQRILNIPSWKE